MTSRRQMLKSSLALAAGAVGFGAARKVIGGSGGADPPPAPTSSSARMPKSLSLTGRNVHAVSNGRPMGHGPDAGERTALSGELVDANGAALGNFYASSTAFGSPLDGPAPVVESHTFRLPDGSTGWERPTMRSPSSVEPGGTWAPAGATPRRTCRSSSAGTVPPRSE